MANPQNGAFYGSVEEYVKARGGNRPIKKVSRIVWCFVQETKSLRYGVALPPATSFCWVLCVQQHRVCRSVVSPAADDFSESRVCTSSLYHIRSMYVSRINSTRTHDSDAARVWCLSAAVLRSVLQEATRVLRVCHASSITLCTRHALVSCFKYVVVHIARCDDGDLRLELNTPQTMFLASYHII